MAKVCARRRRLSTPGDRKHRSGEPFERPKSVSTTCPASEIRMFSGLRSLRRKRGQGTNPVSDSRAELKVPVDNASSVEPLDTLDTR